MTLPSYVQPQTSTNSGAILLIDDEKPLLTLFAETLSPLFEVVQATSAREAGFIMHKKAFKVVVFIPLLPGFEGDVREEKSAVRRIQLYREYSSKSPRTHPRPLPVP